MNYSHIFHRARSIPQPIIIVLSIELVEGEDLSWLGLPLLDSSRTLQVPEALAQHNYLKNTAKGESGVTPIMKDLASSELNRLSKPNFNSEALLELNLVAQQTKGQFRCPAPVPNPTPLQRLNTSESDSIEQNPFGQDTLCGVSYKINPKTQRKNKVYT